MCASAPPAQAGQCKVCAAPVRANRRRPQHAYAGSQSRAAPARRLHATLTTGRVKRANDGTGTERRCARVPIAAPATTIPAHPGRHGHFDPTVGLIVPLIGYPGLHDWHRPHDNLAGLSMPGQHFRARPTARNTPRHRENRQGAPSLGILLQSSGCAPACRARHGGRPDFRVRKDQ